MTKFRLFSAAGFILLLAAMPIAHAQQSAATDSAENFVRSHYTKYEYRIPMRDGKRLFTAVYVPKDAFRRPGPLSLPDGPDAL